MSEVSRTLTFVVAGGILGAAAWVARPAAPEPRVYDDAGEPFFEPFDPLDARSLEIVEYDEETGRVETFKVAHVDGVWSIPSHESYPADAENQLARAAAAIVPLVRSPSVTDNAGDHELHGLIDPAEAGVGSTGVGTRVTLRDAGDNVLADLIIGEQLRDMEQLRYVRQPGKARVYTAEISLDAFSTAFSDWIEDDLLGIRPSELRRVVVNDYSIDEVNGQIIQRDLVQLDFDTDSRTWSLEGLSAGEALDNARINEMKWALDDLKIVDVHRKPAGLSAELRAEDSLVLDAEAIGSLRSRGFYIHEGRLYSNEGEMTVGTADGVLYTLRFGEIAPGAAPSAGEDGESGGASRYLFVTASFDADLIPPPVLDEVPPINMEGLVGEDEGEEVRQAMEEARARTRAGNDAKQERYLDEIEAGEARVRELNDRFADWYYVISDSVYQKIKLRRADLIEPAEDEGDLG